MNKLDLTKKYKSYYTAKTRAEIVEIEPIQYLSITGKGDPSGKDFAEKIQALYTTAYTIKFMYKALDKDFVVAKLEALWWFDEKLYGSYTMEEAPLKIPRSEWEYRLLIRMPDYVTLPEVEKGIQTAIEKKKSAYCSAVEFYQMEEGKVVQILHVGPFSTEPESLQKMAEVMQAKAFLKNGLHHEIYLSDFNKTEPSKLKTILREPVK